MKRLIIADCGLWRNMGHHPNACRHIRDAAAARGIPVEIYGHVDVDDEVRAALGAIPHFAAYTYLGSDGTPFCGWLNTFFLAKDATRRDLERLPNIGKDDVVLVHGARAVQLMAAAEWAAGIPEQDCPVIIVEMGSNPGVQLRETGSGTPELMAPDPNINPEPTLGRFAAQWLSVAGNRPLHVITYDVTVSDIYTRVMGQTVGVLPFPAAPLGRTRNRTGQRPMTIAALGHQQSGKGYHLLPDIIEPLLKAEYDIRFVVHNSDPRFENGGGGSSTQMLQAQARLRAMAAADGRLTLIDGAVDYAAWVALFEKTDIVLCPYDPRRFAVQHSGMASSAIASGVPLVVPANTALSKMMDAYGEIGTTFEGYQAAAVADALKRLLARYDEYADRAFSAAARWNAAEGTGGFVNAVMKLHAERTVIPRTPLYDPALGIFPPALVRAQSQGPAADPAALKARGDDYLRQGKFAEARASYERAIAGNPVYAEAHCNLGVALRELGDLVGAERRLRIADDLAPDRVRILINLGGILSSLNKEGEAIEVLRRALQIEPGNGWVKNNLASALVKQKSWDEAVALLSTVAQELPHEPTVWFNLGTAREGAEDFKGALAAYRKAVEMRPDFHGAAEKAAALSARAG